MSYEKLCQAFLYMAEDTLHSLMYLEHTIMIHLSQEEERLIRAIWHRSSRFGQYKHVRMTYTDYLDGSGPSYCGNNPIPNYVVTERSFYRIQSRLLRLGLIHKSPQNKGFLITCYPLNAIERNSTLMEKLQRDTERGQAIAASIEKSLTYYGEFASYFLEKREATTIQRTTRKLSLVATHTDPKDM